MSQTFGESSLMNIDSLSACQRAKGFAEQFYSPDSLLDISWDVPSVIVA